jgi:hypothetical protein
VVRIMGASLRLAFAGWFVVASGGCQAFEPPPSPHPALVALTDRLLIRFGAGELVLLDPRRLDGFPIGLDDAIRRATGKMDPASVGGLTVAWGAQVATGVGARTGWIVMRGDPRDPALTGKDFALELVVIDALTGESIEWGRPAGLRPPPLAP